MYFVTVHNCQRGYLAVQCYNLLCFVFPRRYESATDGGAYMQGQWDALSLPGAPRRELIYQPPQTEWTTPAHTPHTPTPDQGLMEAEGEVDSGFQEAGVCFALTCPPLVSPERAKEALMSGSGKYLVPMVGPQQTPVSDELSTTYKEKARQASEYYLQTKLNNPEITKWLTRGNKKRESHIQCICIMGEK